MSSTKPESKTIVATTPEDLERKLSRAARKGWVLTQVVVFENEYWGLVERDGAHTDAAGKA